MGLTGSRCANSPSSSAYPSLRWDFAFVFKSFATCFGNSLRNFFLPATRCYSLPQNKKPGVERRVQPPTLGWLHAMLDFFLACARKEPHLGSLLTFESDCDAPVSPVVLQPPGPFVTIPAFFFSSSPSNNYFARFPQPHCPLCKSLILGIRSSSRAGWQAE